MRLNLQTSEIQRQSNPYNIAIRFKLNVNHLCTKRGLWAKNVYNMSLNLYVFSTQSIKFFNGIERTNGYVFIIRAF